MYIPNTGEEERLTEEGGRSWRAMWTLTKIVWPWDVEGKIQTSQVITVVISNSYDRMSESSMFCLFLNLKWNTTITTGRLRWVPGRNIQGKNLSDLVSDQRLRERRSNTGLEWRQYSLLTCLQKLSMQSGVFHIKIYSLKWLFEEKNEPFWSCVLGKCLIGHF